MKGVGEFQAASALAKCANWSRIREGRSGRGARDIVATSGIVHRARRTDQQGAAHPPSGCRRQRRSRLVIRVPPTPPSSPPSEIQSAPIQLTASKSADGARQGQPRKVRAFKDAEGFYKWLAKHHDKEDEVWIKIHKVDSGLKSITPKQAIDVVLCWGWIDGIRKGLDDKSFLQRYSPRGRKSVWSQINVDNVARLIQEGRMTAHGLKHVEAAKADGRWDRAYRSGKE